MEIIAKRSIHLFVLFTLVIVTGLFISGCGKDKDEVKYHTREGRVASINQDTHTFEGWFYSPKYKKELKIAGSLDRNVEILINGATATVADVRVDDKVTVTTKVIKRGEEKEFIATKVEVTRSEEKSAPASSEPASASADPAQ